MSHLKSLQVGQDYPAYEVLDLLALIPMLQSDGLSTRRYDFELKMTVSRRSRHVGFYTLPVFYTDWTIAANFLLVGTEPPTLRCIFLDEVLANTLPLTPAQAAVKAYLVAGGAVCPYCKSDQIEGHSIDMEDDFVSQVITCPNCQGSWTDIYQLRDAILDTPNLLKEATV